MLIDSKTGIWLNNSLEGHGYDQKLSDAIVFLLKKHNIKSVYDFGCGHGEYTYNIIKNGIMCLGFDGNPHTKDITCGLCEVLDLSKPFKLNKICDCVLCLEVGEHIPEEFEQNLINNINNHNCLLIIISWAIVGQGGDGHVNCRNNDYIKNIFINLGYTNLIEDEEFLRNNSLFEWFKNTIMVFKKEL